MKKWLISILAIAISNALLGQEPAQKAGEGHSVSAPSFPGEKTDFHGFDCYQFKIDNNRVGIKIISPKKAAPGKPWLWRSLFWEAISRVHMADLELVKEGYHVVLVHGDVAGHPSGNANIDAAYDLLTKDYGFTKKCSMSSMSRGTLSLFRWATENPEKVESIYVDNGVCNVLSWPAGKLVPGSGSVASGAPKSWEGFKKKFNYASDEEALKTKESPIDLLEPLAKSGVPILLVCGNKDTAVPYEENDAILEKRYLALGGPIKVIVEEKGHSHGMEDPTPILNFIREHTQATQKQSSMSKKAPNVVFIFIDDMGYGDIEPFGSKKNKTPHLNRMAAEGVKLTDFYVSSTACTPSRSALLTGCYADRVGMNGKVVFPGEARGLNQEEITIAEMLKAEGYATACFGKWHLGDQPQFMPLNQGFDEYEGIPYSNDMWPHLRDFPPLPYMKGKKPVAHIPDAPSQALLCEAYTDAAIDFISRHQEQPFFVYLPHSAVHLPRLVTKEEGDLAGGDATRAQVEAVDKSVGRILTTLQELNLDKNTLVFFTSDNGPARGLTAAPLRGAKGGPRYEGNMRMPTLAWWPGTIPAGSVCSEIGTSIDILPTLAQLCNAEIPTDRVIDGKDISTLLTTPNTQSPHPVLYYGYEGIRQGNWKAVKMRGGFHLFDLSQDIGEKKNLASEHPEKVEALNALLQAHRAKMKNDRRPHGTAKNPQPILSEPGDLPTLAEYLNQADLETVGSIHKPTK